MNTFANLQNRAAQVATRFEISMEEAWQKIHGWIDRELGLIEPTVQKVDGELKVVAQEVSAAAKEDVAKVEAVVEGNAVTTETSAAVTPATVSGSDAAPAAEPTPVTEPAPAAEEATATTEEVPPTTGG